MKRLFLVVAVAVLCCCKSEARGAIRLGEPVVHATAQAWLVQLTAARDLVWRSFSLSRPARIVLDLHGVTLADGDDVWPENDGVIKDIRVFRHRDGMVRFVFDLRHKASYLVTNMPGGLTVSISRAAARSAHRVRVTERVVPSRVAVQAPSSPADLVIAIDPGHGGIDTGACGIDGICEKNVVLRIGLDLAAMIDATPGLHAYLTRHGDYYVPLRTRVLKAEAHHAAAFISIHANSLPGPEGRTIRGAEIFILSRHGVTREARWLARSENAADRVGSVHFGTHNGFLHNILLNMTQNGTRRASYQLANDILGQIGHMEPIHVDYVQKANFLVLESPTIPSVLIETAFISNPRMAFKLNNPVYDRRLARAIWRGVVRDAPALRARLGETRLPRLYMVRAGETLSGIAARFHVSLSALQEANALKGPVLYAGTQLHIPPPT